MSKELDEKRKNVNKMDLRKDQIELLERIEPGLVWKWHVDPETDSKIIHLRELDLVQAREDIKHDLLCLTELGKSVLDLARQNRREQAEQKRRDEAAEAVRLRERRDDIANAEQQLQSQNEATEELQKLRQDFDQYRADYASYKAAEEHRAKIAERKGFWRGILSGIITTIVGGLVIYYWPDIIALMHQLWNLLSLLR